MRSLAISLPSVSGYLGMLDELNPFLERILLILATLAYAIAFYYVLGKAAVLNRAVELWSPWDPLLPFLPWSVHAYGLVYTAVLFPAFCVADRNLFRRAIIAYWGLLSASFATFAIFPVTSARLRVPAEMIDVSEFSGWGLRLIYYLDPPFNLFPSLHLGLALVATISVWMARRSYGLWASAGAAAIGVSIFTTRQHFIADALFALFLAPLSCALAFRGYHRPSKGTACAFGWRGPALFLGLHATIYAFFFALYLADWKPWLT